MSFLALFCCCTMALRDGMSHRAVLATAVRTAVRLGLVTAAHPSSPLTRRSQCYLWWSIRLGFFLYHRLEETRSDFRFEPAKRDKQYGYLFFSWTMQGIWCVPVALHLLSLTLLLGRGHERETSGLFSHGDAAAMGGIVPILSDLAAVAVFLAGLLIEHVADAQKSAFRRRRERGEVREAWISTGLWKFSRHPNYCGESMLHLGLAWLCANGLRTAPLSWWIPFVSPVFSAVFLMVTSLPWLE